ncbi:MAG: glycoside hydrolase family 2 TIM barrel-domain containing protein [Tepidisphaeraceae bacterium]|jgi:beta-galactosidase
MRITHRLLCSQWVSLSFCILICVSCRTTSAGLRQIVSFDPDWRFLEQDANAAQEPEFRDANWRKLNVPHDWSIEGAAAATNPSGGAGGFFPDGIGWYRKHFTLSEDDASKRIFIVFDSVMANSDVWINGIFLGHRPYGYVELNYELTGHLNFGADKSNVLAVRVDQERQPASRYYMGAGIIGHVRLVITDPVHVEHNSAFVTTPEVAADHAVVNVKFTVDNQSDAARNISAKVMLIDPDGQTIQATAQPIASQSIDAGKSGDFSENLTVTNPKLWDLDHPQLYKAEVTILDGDSALDDHETIFGIRTIKFDPATGFLLNGKNIRIQGVCLHADNSAFGTAVPVGVWERRLSALKQFGVNGLRTAHNPPSPAFLDLCDRMGFLVMDEMYDCWDVGKNKYDYHLYFDQWSLTDLRDTVRRDRNHPSIILYSAGNEIHDTPNAVESIRILTGLVKEFHANDPTRPVTEALLRPNASHDYDDGLADLLDVVGTNYRMSELLAAQQAKPTRTLIGTEDQLGDVEILAKNPPLSGIFIWSGVDYLGEAFRFPQITGASGLLDRTDLPKASAYQVATVWTSKPFVAIFRGAPIGRGARGGGRRGGAIPTTQEVVASTTAPSPIDGDFGAPGGPGPAGAGVFAAFGRRGPTQDWTPTNLDAHPETVTIYTNCPKLDLTLNGAPVQGNMTTTASGAKTMSIAFAPGVLKAVGYDASGNAVASDELHTAGPATKIVLTADKSSVPNDWDDVSFIRATVVDANGLTVPSANDEISFQVGGPGSIVAVDSADTAYHESFRGTQRQAYGGICFAVVKSNAATGEIIVNASAKGLTDGNVTLDAAPAVR